MHYISYTKESLKVGRDNGERCIGFSSFRAAKAFEGAALQDASRVEYIGFSEDGKNVSVARGNSFCQREATKTEQDKFNSNRLAAYAL